MLRGTRYRWERRVRSASVHIALCEGYLDNPEDTENAFWEGGWFRSGDVGIFDDNEYIYIVDRVKDLIITGGENVYPREVEEVIYTYPEVQECAVIGIPDKEWGERVTAVLVPRPEPKNRNQTTECFP